MKILNIVGSPRVNGNTHFLAQKFAEGAKRNGVETEEVFLGRMKIAPCLDCGQCHEDGICRIKDDFGLVAEKMKACEGILFSTPVYCCNVTGQLKAFMDRCHSLMFPDYTTGLEGKKAVFIIVSGYPPPQEEMAIVQHTAPIEVLLDIERKIKVSTGELRCSIDPMRPFDPTIDTLRTLYQFCAFNRLEVAGFLEVTGLGNDRETIRRRPDELRKAEEFGARFAEMLTAFKREGDST
jgi:multimeric flavodoxin WrbA